MNTYVIVLNNGKQIAIQADDFERNTERIRFVDLTKDKNVAIFMNNIIAGFYIKDYKV